MSYISPINSRYKAPFMSNIWCSDNKIITMRQLWIDLAIFQKELGVETITNNGIDEMVENRNHIDYQVISHYESKFKHDIMAHIYAYSDLCPSGKNMIHLGATSNFINDNVDMILIKKSLQHITKQTNAVFETLKSKSIEYKSMPTLAYTHLQAAQLITVGKRFCFWNADILMDLENLQNLLLRLPFRGIKGTVGSEDTILKLFDNDHEKCNLLNTQLADKYCFKNRITICGQTYSRKYDLLVVQGLSSICQSIYKMMNDIRLLSSKGEIYENFEKEQIGSSAMPYKMNPITCEKICSLCRFVINNETTMSQTYINQWLERSLDDSALKRIIYPDCFMLVEHILNETQSCLTKLFVNRTQIENNVHSHLNNILSEQIILLGVKMGYNRQDIHERLRIILINEETPNFDSDEVIKHIFEKNDISLNPMNYIGRCVEQIDTFYL